MEAINSLNQRLIDYFGHDDLGRAIWRIVWSDFQYEKRLTQYSKEGFELIYPKVEELPKYPYVKSKWVLERLVLVPEINELELPVSKVSYEPMWIFQNDREENL